jgi:hypothetical protein
MPFNATTASADTAMGYGASVVQVFPQGTVGVGSGVLVGVTVLVGVAVQASVSV